MDKETKERIGRKLAERAKNSPSLLKLFKSDRDRDTFFRHLGESDPGVSQALVKAIESYKKESGQSEEDFPVKVTFECEDMYHLKRLSKADDMANFIHELVHNIWQEWKESNYDYVPVRRKIAELLEDHGIQIDDLTY